ncbi:hypothetical protein LTR78_005177 [Recurvomyces mirabilis]|uniref:LisH domain-containing protein n=1 Tax=Recurvomyces mirabilis TaxID=574656 RepID=A0AAE1C1W9_9PEZI|nr:hypothetical protein LTR78_005177 [Recurvomyces mirabilis]KAK5157727.1 hypothetical protein LTS14_003649 [Recurvomyces mirabilis]
MPATDSPAIIVARFLKSSNYDETYDAFIAEAGLPPDAGMVEKGDLTLEVLLEEKKTFDLSARFEKLGVEGGGARGWVEGGPEKAEVVRSLPTSSNVLSVAAYDTEAYGATLLVSTADRRLHVLNARTKALRASLSGLQDSPILSTLVYREKFLLTASMSGQLLVSGLDGRSIERRRDHTKYIVKIAMLENDAAGPLLATAGWDCKVVLYWPSVDEQGKFILNDPVATITLPTKPEAMVLMRHPESLQLILLVTRTDSNLIYYYSTETSPRLLGKQNLAPHSNAWVAFTPSAMALCPTDPTLLAVGTSSVPHMKLLLVRLLVPPFASSSEQAAPVRTSLLDETPVPDTQASQARRELAIADREAAAIQIHCTTMAPQTAYSTPAVAWRPNGSGVWVNGDDGAVRGIEASSGKVVRVLREGGHEEGSKVRCIWGGMVEGEEVLLSGGFDQRLVVWRSDREV